MSDKKTSLSNINKSKQETTVKQKKGTYFELYKDFFTGKEKPVPVRFIEKLGEELVEWAAKDNKALILTQFFFDRGIGERTMYNWRERYPNFKESCTQARRIIGNRREIGAIKRTYDSGMIRTTMRLYSDDWKNIEDERAEQRQKRDQTVAQSTIQWVMEKFPTVKEVPDKNNEAEKK